MMSGFPFTQAQWVWTAEAGDARWAVRRFRSRFALDSPQTVTLSVCADSRYILFCDGRQLGRGPVRSDVRHQMYDTHTVLLAAGTHLLAAVVLSYQGEDSPISEMHDRGAFLCEAHGEDGEVLSATGRADDWRVLVDDSLRPAPGIHGEAYYGIGASETVDGTRFPHGWEMTAYDDGAWPSPSPIAQAWAREQPVDYGDPGGRWRLLPRDLPAPRDEARKFAPSFEPVTVAVHSCHQVILTPGEYVIGFPVLDVEGGVGSVVTLTYAEAMTTDGKKSVRDAGTNVSGFSDTYRCGGRHETYQPLHWRAFRFVKVTIETGDTPLTVHSLSFRQTGYPWQYRAAFAVENGPSELPAILETDFRTLSCCTDETFMDCPYYEQLQYVGDTRLQSLLSYVTTGDTRLGARAVRLFDWSRGAEGLTQSRYPSRLEQVIPPFSLLWVLMVEDLSRYAPAEAQTVADALPGCRNVLEWFGRHLNEDGVLGGRLPWWNFVDWSAGFAAGAPLPLSVGRPCATINLQYLAALQAVSRLQETSRYAGQDASWQEQAAKLAAAIFCTFWDKERGLLREGPISDTDAWEYTQHAQAWGILTGVVPAEAVQSVCDSLHTDETLTRATYYGLFYVVEALAQAGRLEQLWTRWLALWRQALNMGLTTWPEQPEPTRSDCHAWSAWPTYTFLTHVLGVRPDPTEKTGYAMSPKQVQGWGKVTGVVALPRGKVDAAVTWQADGTSCISHSMEEDIDYRPAVGPGNGRPESSASKPDDADAIGPEKPSGGNADERQ